MFVVATKGNQMLLIAGCAGDPVGQEAEEEAAFTASDLSQSMAGFPLPSVLACLLAWFD